PRVPTRNTHGSGCAFSAAITAGLAKGASIQQATGEAKRFITGAIREALEVGGGHGPVNPMWSTPPLPDPPPRGGREPRRASPWSGRPSRPDINQRYNMGGWPTTAFLTPQGDILTGATYLPADQMADALARVVTYYRQHKPEVVAGVLEGRKRAGARVAASAGSLDPGLVD